MSVLADLLAELFREPTPAGVARELALLAAPLCLAALVGLLLGWAWRPRWAAAVVPANPEQVLAAAQAPVTPPTTQAVAAAKDSAVVPR